MWGRLQGKVAIITGAARGQGLAEVQRFRSEGAEVVAGDVLDHDGIHLDVASAESWSVAIAHTVDRHGRVDVLVNNAGIHAASPVHEMAEADFRRVLDVNLVGPFLGIQAVVPAMVDGGSIINVSSRRRVRSGSAVASPGSTWSSCTPTCGRPAPADRSTLTGRCPRVEVRSSHRPPPAPSRTSRLRPPTAPCAEPNGPAAPDVTAGSVLG